MTSERKPAATDPDVSRRDFLNTVAVGASALLLPSAEPNAIPQTALNDPPMYLRTGYVPAHDGTPIYYEVHGSGDRVLLLGPYTAPSFDPARHTSGDESKQDHGSRHAYDAGLTDRYRLVLFDYPGEPKMYTLSPGTVARDYLAIADAVGAKEFAYFGYSWGAVTGLQLAMRTKRLKALVCGGFPMIGGPYKEMLTLCTTLYDVALRADTADPRARKDWVAYGSIPAPDTRAFLTFYEALRGFDDRKIQYRITCPRLCFGGTADVEMLGDRVLCRIGDLISAHRSEMIVAGWQVKLLAGKDHETAAAAAVAVPLVRSWLDAQWPA